MRWKIPAVLVALAFLIPVASGVAQAGTPAPSQPCQTGERKVYKDFRQLVTIDLTTASDTDVRVLADQLLTEARAESLPTLPQSLQHGLDGNPADLRAFLETGLLKNWTSDLRLPVVQTLNGAGPHVTAAAQEALDAGTVDAYLAYLNDGLYVARALDCASPSPSLSASASASPTASASASVSSSASASASVSPAAAVAGTLPRTGANTSFLAIGGSALILVGIGVVLVARRVRA
jgi:LPXTG-motif cell wall-anchored protein